MKRVILQVPMSEELRDKAEKSAKEQGFSSLQETIRIFLTNLSTGNISLRIEQFPEEKLSKKAEKRYAKILEEIKDGKNVTKTSSLDELMQYLKS